MLTIVDMYNHHSEGLHCWACSNFRTDISTNVYPNFGAKCRVDAGNVSHIALRVNFLKLDHFVICNCSSRSQISTMNLNINTYLVVVLYYIIIILYYTIIVMRMRTYVQASKGEIFQGVTIVTIVRVSWIF